MTGGGRGTVIVGAGLMGTWHAQTLRMLGRAIVAVVDADPARARSLAQRYQAAAVPEIGDALALQPFAVHVCTPPESHPALVAASVEAGAHCLVEKPFAPDAAATRHMLEMAAGRGVLACPVHQFLFQRGVRRARGLLPRFGPLVHLDFVACSAGAALDGDSVERRRRLALDILPHPLSMLRRLTDLPLDVQHWTVLSPSPGEVRITGITGTASVGILISASGRPTRNTVRLIGRRGTVHVDLFHGFATLEPPGVSRFRKIARPFTTGAATISAATANIASRVARREPAYPGLRELVAAFYIAAEEGGAPPIGPDETVNVAEAVERLGASLTATR